MRRSLWITVKIYSLNKFRSLSSSKYFNNPPLTALPNDSHSRGCKAVSNYSHGIRGQLHHPHGAILQFAGINALCARSGTVMSKRVTNELTAMYDSRTHISVLAAQYKMAKLTPRLPWEDVTQHWWHLSSKHQLTDDWRKLTHADGREYGSLTQRAWRHVG